MASFLPRVRGTIGVALLTGTAWVPVGAVFAVTSLYMILRASRTAVPLSVVWGTALRRAVIFGVWGVLTGALTAVVVATVARWRNQRQLNLGRTIAYAAIGQSMLLIGARVLAAMLPWHGAHRAAVALREMPLPLVALGGAVIVGTGLLILRRTEGFVAPS